MWRVLDGEFDWFVLEDGKYIDLVADTDGIYPKSNFSRALARSHSPASRRDETGAGGGN